MFTIVLIFVSGFQLLLPLPDTTDNDSQQRCVEVALKIAHHINDNVNDASKVESVKCLRNA